MSTAQPIRWSNSALLQHMICYFWNQESMSISYRLCSHFNVTIILQTFWLEIWNKNIFPLLAESTILENNHYGQKEEKTHHVWSYIFTKHKVHRQRNVTDTRWSHMTLKTAEVTIIHRCVCVCECEMFLDVSLHQHQQKVVFIRGTWSQRSSRSWGSQKSEARWT